MKKVWYKKEGWIKKWFLPPPSYTEAKAAQKRARSVSKKRKEPNDERETPRETKKEKRRRPCRENDQQEGKRERFVSLAQQRNKREPRKHTSNKKKGAHETLSTQTTRNTLSLSLCHHFRIWWEKHEDDDDDDDDDAQRGGCDERSFIRRRRRRPRRKRRRASFFTIIEKKK